MRTLTCAVCGAVKLTSELRTVTCSKSCGARYREWQRNPRLATEPDFVERRRVAWNRWSGMMQRCTNPDHVSWADYGGRGIKVCDRWQSFRTYWQDTGDRPGEGYTVDRIDNDGDYEPSNVRWATPAEQNANRRPSRPRKPRLACKRGHEFTPENTYLTPTDRRACRTCQRERDRQYRTRKAAA